MTIWQMIAKSGQGPRFEAIRVNTQNVQEVLDFCYPTAVAMSDSGLVLLHDWGNELARWGSWILKDDSGRLRTADNEVFLNAFEPAQEVYP